MTYNGIGLRTARGSGTNGYIQRNLAHISRPKQEFIVGLKTQLNNKRKVAKPNKLRVDTSIMQHNQKRQIEVLVYKQRCQYEDEGIAEAEIETRLADYRRTLSQKMEHGMNIHPINGADNEQNSHQRTAQQLRKNAVMRNALGLTENDGGDIQDEWELRRREKRSEREEALTEEQRLQYEMHKLSKHPLDHSWSPALQVQRQTEQDSAMPADDDDGDDDKRSKKKKKPTQKHKARDNDSDHDHSDSAESDASDRSASSSSSSSSSSSDRKHHHRATRTEHKKRERSRSSRLHNARRESKKRRRHRDRSESRSVSRSRSRSRSRNDAHAKNSDDDGGRWGDERRHESTSPSKSVSPQKQKQNDNLESQQTDKTNNIHKNEIVPDF
eukprot:CAMPEP_0202701256 /NCGR_PEP_ID=MMETSP1385-20130828/14353_1 /ASSEMBLY_ACC=CAM_ASM_000861 /TAXON_ID=933848 /ORGANISM="Elphidium margaritaceum" /LENGTH=383 /DNA_ID=CAMNT_0049358631 /DNA_START=44 /DNA_END=1195 /DNA_ORIENTATION=-